jgi:hypothetical protein
MYLKGAIRLASDIPGPIRVVREIAMAIKAFISFLPIFSENNKDSQKQRK